MATTSPMAHANLDGRQIHAQLGMRGYSSLSTPLTKASQTQSRSKLVVSTLELGVHFTECVYDLYGKLLEETEH